MPRDLFAVSAGDPSTRRSRRLIPLSIGLHAVALAAAVVVPLFAVGDPPPVAERHPLVILAQPALPRVELVPAPPRPARVSQATATRTPGPEHPPVNIVTPDSIRPEAHVDSGVPEWLPQGGAAVGLGSVPSSGVDGGTAVSAPAGPIRISTGVKPPRKLKHVAPEYPRVAREARLEGLVVIDAVIGPDGYVRQALVRRSDSSLLESAALAAVRQWVYVPTRLNDVPVAVVMSVEIRFTLSR